MTTPPIVPRLAGDRSPGPARPAGVPVPRLTGRRAEIRPWRDEDAPRIVQACRDPRTRHWLAGLPPDYDEDDARDYLRHYRRQVDDGSGWFAAVADPGTGQLLAAVAVLGLTAGDPTSGELGYWTHPAARGHGVMTEAVRLVVGYAFGSVADGGLGLRRLAASVAAGNTASLRVVHQNRFVRTGIQREAEPLGDGSYADLVTFDRLASD